MIGSNMNKHQQNIDSAVVRAELIDAIDKKVHKLDAFQKTDESVFKELKSFSIPQLRVVLELLNKSRDLAYKDGSDDEYHNQQEHENMCD